MQLGFHAPAQASGLYSPTSNRELLENCAESGISARSLCAIGTGRTAIDTVLTYGFTLHVFHQAGNEQFDVIESAEAFLEMTPSDFVEHIQDEENRANFEATRLKVRSFLELSAQVAELTYDLLQIMGPLAEFLGDLNGFLGGLSEGLEAANAGIAEANKGLKQMNEAMVTVNSGLDQMNAGISTANAGMDKANAGIREANEGMRKLNSGASGMVDALGDMGDLIEGERSIPVDLGGLDLNGLGDVYGERDVESIFEDADRQRRMSLLLDLTPGVGDAKGLYEGLTGQNPVTEEEVSGFDRALGSVVFLSTLKSSYKGADTLVNMARYREVMGAAENSNELIASLRNTGQLPSHYVTKGEASESGWKSGRALGNHVPNGQIGGDVFQNSNNLLPGSPGRTWYEADVGLTNEMKRSKQPGTRLLYSDDGLLYVTADHYGTAQYIGRYK